MQLIGVEPAGRGLDTPDHAATMTLGTKGAIHGFICYNLQDERGEPLPVYSIASGLDYPGVGPQHCYLKDVGRVADELAKSRDRHFAQVAKCLAAAHEVEQTFLSVQNCESSPRTTPIHLHAIPRTTSRSASRCPPPR